MPAGFHVYQVLVTMQVCGLQLVAARPVRSSGLETASQRTTLAGPLQLQLQAASKPPAA
jgi:hypothetical protein